MRVLHVISGLDARAGGPVVTLAGLVQGQVRAGMDVSIFSTGQEGADPAAAEQFRSCGARVEQVGPSKTPLQWHPKLKETVLECVRHADIVHIHSIWEEAQHQAARAAARKKVPYLMRPCGMLAPWSLAKGNFKKKLYLALRLRRNLNRAAALHFDSQMEQELVSGLKLQAPAIVEPNGIRLDEFSTLPPRGTFRGRYPQIGRRPLISFLGRVHPGKGVEYLLPAFARLKGDAMLVIGGPDSDGFLGKMQARAADLGIANKVIFTGMLHGAQRVEMLVDSDLFCLPSEHENFGVAIIEALAAGVPAIISPEVGIPKQITAAGVGAAVATDPVTLSTELERWLADPELRRAAAEKARAFVWQNYDWQQIAVRWMGHYQKLIGG
jgi:glycosyltransferase involved in cell wall biosynthesis